MTPFSLLKKFSVTSKGAIMENDLKKLIGKSYSKQNILRSIEDHTEDLLTVFNSLQENYKNSFTPNKQDLALIKTAITFHDFGKANILFQQHITNAKKNPEEINHGFLSCAYLNMDSLEEQFCFEDIQALVTAIFTHHHERSDEAKYDHLFFKDHIEKYLPTEVIYKGQIYSRNFNFLSFLINPFRNNNFYKNRGNLDKLWSKYILIKGLLNRIDNLASAGVKTLEIDPLKAGTLTKNIIETHNSHLREVQTYVSENNKEENLIINSATGSGKTEAALLWLDGSKAFYILPLRVSINDIYNRITDIYKYPKEKINLHYSDLFFVSLAQSTEQESQNSNFIDWQDAECLSYPFTICTLDKIFAFVFKYLGSEMIPSTLRYSKIVIDEIHSYSPEILAYLIYGLKIITELGGKFAIMTATFPPILEYFLQKEGIPVTISPYFLGENETRHKIKFIENFADNTPLDFDYQKIIAESKNKKVLVICNTVEKAQDVFNKLQNKLDYIYLLHNRFIIKHKNQLETEIINFSRNKDQKGLWISAQTVEASLDIDFELLFTEMCPADALIQRMGRCYRHNNYQGSEPNILIYNTPNNITDPAYQEILSRSIDNIKKYTTSYFTEKQKFEYIQEVYKKEDLENSHFSKEIKTHLKNLKNLLPTALDKTIGNNQFKHIRSKQILPECFRQDINQYINILKNQKEKDNQNSKKEILKYTIILEENNLPETLLKNIEKNKISKDLNVYTCNIEYQFTPSPNHSCIKGPGLILP